MGNSSCTGSECVVKPDIKKIDLSEQKEVKNEGKIYALEHHTKFDNLKDIISSGYLHTPFSLYKENKKRYPFKSEYMLGDAPVSHDYKGVYTKLISEYTDTNEIEDKNMFGGIKLILCKDLLDRGDFHFLPVMYYGMLIENKTYFNDYNFEDLKEEDYTEENEIVFHNPINIKDNLLQIWLDEKNKIYLSEIKKLLAVNGLGGVEVKLFSEIPDKKEAIKKIDNTRCKKNSKLKPNYCFYISYVNKNEKIDYYNQKIAKNCGLTLEEIKDYTNEELNKKLREKLLNKISFEKIKGIIPAKRTRDKLAKKIDRLKEEIPGDEETVYYEILKKINFPSEILDTMSKEDAWKILDRLDQTTIDKLSELVESEKRKLSIEGIKTMLLEKGLKGGVLEGKTDSDIYDLYFNLDQVGLVGLNYAYEENKSNFGKINRRKGKGIKELLSKLEKMRSKREKIDKM